MTTEQRDELRRLDRCADELLDRYLELRDAKSSGCCAGMTIREVTRYDARIIEAHNKYTQARDAVYAFRQNVYNNGGNNNDHA